MPDGILGRLSRGCCRLWLVALLGGVMLLATGCATRQRDPRPVATPQGIERPARPLAEERSLGEHAGNVAVAVFVVGVTLALIVLPIVFLL